MQGASTSREHAVVVGGSMAGLLAARVLSNHFERVTIVERDELPTGAAHRVGVPQSRHVHALLPRGEAIMERLLPGLRDDLVTEGAQVVRLTEELAWLTPAGWGARFPSYLTMLSCGREQLERYVRQRVCGLAGVEVVSGHGVVGLIGDRAARAVVGVSLSRREADRGRREVGALWADLVVDAAGRGSRTPAWLEALGYEAPAQSVIAAGAGYASRVYRRPHLPDGYQGIYLQSAPPAMTRGGLIFPLDEERCLVSMVGLGGDHPAGDEQGFLAFARSVRSPMLHQAIAEGEPLGEIATSRSTENRVRHYERCRMPERLVVLGDAACAFNPVYGQGMTTAAIGAELLDACLTRSDRPMGDLGPRFQRRLARLNTTPWTLATGEDARVDGVLGTRPTRSMRFMQGYVDRVVALSTTKAAARLTLLEVFAMLKPPTALFAPSILGQILSRRRRAAHSTAVSQGAPSVAPSRAGG